MSTLKATSTRLTVGSLREFSTVGIVCGLAAAYAAVLLGASSTMGSLAESSGGAVEAALSIVSSVFIMIALFVSAVVISNGVDTVIAGRLDQLRLLRLVGASAKQLRSSLIRAVAMVSTIGAIVGIVVGLTGVVVVRAILVDRGTIPGVGYQLVPVTSPLAVVAVVGTAIIATVIGARRPLASSAPVVAAKGAPSALRAVVALGLIGIGALILAAAVQMGESGSSSGFFAAFFGSAIVSVGILVGARLIVPALVALCGRAVGGGAAGTLARKNAVSDPLRTTRSTLGLLVGVTLVTTIAAGMSSLTASVRSWEGLTPDEVAVMEQGMAATTAILMAIVAISAIIAAVGFVSTMSLTVISRTREIGMLRAMGFTARQVRSMIFRESMALSGTAVGAGLVLGIIFGAIGSQSLVGSVTDGMRLGLPWPAILAIVGATAALVLIAALPPSRRAISVAPVDALAVT